jgi:hypothetical protein
MGLGDPETRRTLLARNFTDGWLIFWAISDFGTLGTAGSETRENRWYNPEAQKPTARRNLTMFFFQYLLQGGYFFIVPLFCRWCWNLTRSRQACDSCRYHYNTIVAAVGILRSCPRLRPRIVRTGLSLIGLLSLSGIDLMLCGGCGCADGVNGAGMGALASQLGSVTVSALPTEQSGEVGGLKTRRPTSVPPSAHIAGSVLIAASPRR